MKYLVDIDLSGNELKNVLSINEILSFLDNGVSLADGKRIYLSETAYIELKDGHLHTNVGFYSDSFVSSLGLNSSGGGGGGGTSFEASDGLSLENGILKVILASNGGLAFDSSTPNKRLKISDNWFATQVSAQGLASQSYVDNKVGNLDTELDTISSALMSLQSQVDAVASKNNFDELTASSITTDILSAQVGYVASIHFSGGAELNNAKVVQIGNNTTAISGHTSAISTLQGYFTNGKAKTALNAEKLGNQSPSYYATATALSDLEAKLDAMFVKQEDGSIKALAGLWTEQYISALGQNSSGSSGGGTLVEWGVENGYYVPLKVGDNTKNILLASAYTTLNNAISGINAKIPTAATASNQLADKAFVNSSIASNTATFRGTFETISDFPTSNVKENDYAFLMGEDYKRYKYTDGAWVYEYTLNNSSFTQDQWNAITSGATSENIASISGKQEKITSDNKLPYSLISGAPTELPASDVPAWAKASTKPSYNADEISETDNRVWVTPSLKTQISTNATDIGSLSTMMGALQSQIDSVASRTSFDDLSVSSLNSDIIASQVAYIKSIGQTEGISFVGGNTLDNSKVGQITTNKNDIEALAKNFNDAFEIQRDASNNITSIKAKVGLWSEQYISALGQNTTGGGGGGTTFTAGKGLELVEAVLNVKLASNGGLTFTNNNKDLAINTALLTNISNGQTAYGWGNHASVGYLTQHQSLADYAKTADLGSAAFKDVPESGNASDEQVVMGNDSRLTDSRTPKAHTHAIGDVTNLQTTLSDLQDGIEANAQGITDVNTALGGLARVATTGAYSDLSGTPSSLKNPHALTLQFGGTTNQTYDGSEAKTFNVTKAAIGLGNVTNLAASGYFTNLSRTTNTNKISITIGGTQKDITLGSNAWNSTEFYHSGNFEPLTTAEITTIINALFA